MYNIEKWKIIIYSKELVLVMKMWGLNDNEKKCICDEIIILHFRLYYILIVLMLCDIDLFRYLF
jgi:hypothetical protein